MYTGRLELAQVKWPISPPIMTLFLKSLCLPGSLPGLELIAEIVPSFHPSKYSNYLFWSVFAGVLVWAVQRSGRQGSFSCNSYQFTGLEVRCSIHTLMSPVAQPAPTLWQFCWPRWPQWRLGLSLILNLLTIKRLSRSQVSSAPCFDSGSAQTDYWWMMLIRPTDLY